MPYRSELAKAIADNCTTEGLQTTRIDGLMLYRSDRDIPRQPVVYHPAICVVAQGRKQIYFGDHSHRYDPDHYLLNSLTFPIEAEVQGSAEQHPYLGLSLAIEPKLVSQLMLEMDRHRFDGATKKGAEIVSSAPLTEPLSYNLTRLVALNDHSMDREVLCDGIKREIFYEVLKGPQGGLLRNSINNHAGAVRIAPVVHFIEQNYHRSLDIDTIASVASMSPSSLHEHFKEITSMAPMQFVKNLRLHQARSLLLSGTKASEACHSVGYSSPSQFSREFKRLFGDSPSAVLALSGT